MYMHLLSRTILTVDVCPIFDEAGHKLLMSIGSSNVQGCPPILNRMIKVGVPQLLVLIREQLKQKITESPSAIIS